MKLFAVTMFVSTAMLFSQNAGAEQTIIDTHAHVMLPGQERALSPLVSAGVDDLARSMEAANVGKAGIIAMAARGQHEHNRKQNDYLLDLAEGSDKFFPIISVHPLDGDVALEELERAAKRGAKGLKLHPFFQGFDAGDPAVAALVKAAGEHNLTVLFDTISPSDGGMVGKFINLALTNPEINFVLAHFGGSRFHEMVLFDVLKSGPLAVKNVFFDLSAVTSLYVNSPRKDELMWTIREIGVDSFLFGSDFPFFGAKATLEIFEKLGFTEEEIHAMAVDNPKRAYGL